VKNSAVSPDGAGKLTVTVGVPSAMLNSSVSEDPRSASDSVVASAGTAAFCASTPGSPDANGAEQISIMSTVVSATRRRPRRDRTTLPTGSR
jgi:hypothetical protein